MEELSRWVVQRGLLSQGIAACAAAGLLFGLLGLGALFSRARSKRLRLYGVLTLLAATCCLGSAGTDFYLRRRVATQKAREQGLRYPSERERWAQAAFREARYSLALGLGGAALPLLLGAVAMRAASRRRWLEDPDGPYQSPLLGAAIGLLCLLGFGAMVAGLLLKPGERELDEQAWRVLRLHEALAQRDFGACTDSAFAPGRSRAPALVEAQAGCAQPLLAIPVADRGQLEALLALPWMDNEGVRAALKAKLASLDPSPSPLLAPPPAPRDLLQEAKAEVSARLTQCYSKLQTAKTRKRKPTLTLQVAASGEVQRVEQPGGRLKPAALRRCVLAAAKQTRFPASVEGLRSVELGL